MKKILLPAAFVVLGVGTGVGAGLFLRPDANAGEAQAAGSHDGAGGEAGEEPGAAPESHGSAKAASGHESDSHASAGGHGDGGHGSSGEQYVKLGNQFIVPILDASRVKSLVVLTIDLEVGAAGAASVYRVEPKIRDAFLTVLFDHANAGGFSGTFTSSGSMDVLRRSLREAGRKAVGEDVVKDVLITSIVRQDT